MHLLDMICDDLYNEQYNRTQLLPVPYKTCMITSIRTHALDHKRGSSLHSDPDSLSRDRISSPSLDPCAHLSSIPSEMKTPTQMREKHKIP
jgi:hypothetical protein